MEIKAIKFRRDGFYTQPFVMGGEKQQTGDGTTGTEQSDEFDPNIHNAVMHVDDENEKDNTIVDVFSKGYKLGDRILRPAMVKVAN
jgi:hypothetical protein